MSMATIGQAAGGLSDWCRRWTSAGVPTIPLHRFRKAPVCKAWQNRTPADQWHEVGKAFSGNVGAVTGNGLVVIDCDAREAVVNVTNGLKAMGLVSLPTVRTASGTGRHFYLRITGAPNGNYCLLAPNIGSGELQYGGGPMSWRRARWSVATDIGSPTRRPRRFLV
jgi:hypothetical protein